jgi:hypothetical protein
MPQSGTMQPIIQIYVAAVVIAFLSSLLSFRLDLSAHLKTFSLLLALTVLTELTADILNYKRINNWWLYNLFMLIEFPAYAWFYLQVIRKKRLRRILWFFLLIFPIFWAVLIWKSGLRNWNGAIITVGSFFSVLFALMYYHRIITSPDILTLRTLPEFWIATGMLIFYLGSFAFFGMMNFILKHPEVAARLITIYQILDILMYCLFSYGFLCRIMSTKRSLSP